MNYWYYTFHAHTGDLSLFQTPDYEGRGGYATKEDAIKAARLALTKDQRELSLSVMVKSNELSSMAARLDQVSRALLKLEKESF